MSSKNCQVVFSDPIVISQYH